MTLNRRQGSIGGTFAKDDRVLAAFAGAGFVS